MPSFKPDAASAWPATTAAATSAVVPYRAFFITKVPFSKCMNQAPYEQPIRWFRAHFCGPGRGQSREAPKGMRCRQNVTMAFNDAILSRDRQQVRQSGQGLLSFG